MKKTYNMPKIGVMHVTTHNALCASGKPYSPVVFIGGQAVSGKSVL